MNMTANNYCVPSMIGGSERWVNGIVEFIVEAHQEKRITTTGELVRTIKIAIPAKARQDGTSSGKTDVSRPYVLK